MNDPTSISLLERATDTSDNVSWDRLTSIYVPLMKNWLDQYDLQLSDADDIVQEVLAVLMRELPQFDHNGQTGAFRNWLRKILVNRLRQLWRKKQHEPQAMGTSKLLEQLDQLENDSSELSRIWNAEHDQHVIAGLIETVRPRFQEKTWDAFRRQMFEGRNAEEVAQELDMNIASIYAARSRILTALRHEAKGLVDSLE